MAIRVGVLLQRWRAYSSVRSPLGLATVGLVSALTSLGAQNPPHPPAVADAALVRVEALTGNRIEGRFEQYRGDSLLVNSTSLGRTGVPIATLSRVWVRGKATKTGMLVGGLVGIPLGVLTGAALCDFERTQEQNINRDISCVEHYIGGTAFGVALGVGLGALIGQFIPKWHLRFQVAPQRL